MRFSGLCWAISKPPPRSPAFDPLRHGFKELKAVRNANLSHRLRIAMLANGVDIMGAPGGLVSAAHRQNEVARTLEAIRTSVRWMKAEGDIKG